MTSYTHICIDDNWTPIDGCKPRIKFGEHVTVIMIINESDGTFYSIVDHEEIIYESEAFAPLSTIDEMELSQQRLQTV